MLDPFTELSITLANPDVTLPDFFKAVCVAVVKTIPNADRVSLWKFSQDKSDITCLALRVNQEFSQPTGVVYSAHCYPEYFKAILARHTILAIDARNHPDTSCFADSYFESDSVFSLMDYMFENTFSPFGIICCESVGQYAKWGESEVEELKRIARIVSIFSNIRHLCD